MSDFTVDENGFVIDSRGRVVSGHADQNTARSFATMTDAEKVAAGLTVARQRGVRPTGENISAIIASGAMPSFRGAAQDGVLDDLMRGSVSSSPPTAASAPVEPVQTVIPPETVEALEREQPGTAQGMVDDGLIDPAILAVLGIRPAVSAVQGAGASGDVVDSRSGVARRSPLTVADNSPDVTRAEMTGVREAPAETPRLEGPDTRTGIARRGSNITPTTEAQIMDDVTRATPDLVPAPRPDAEPSTRVPRGNVNTATPPNVVTTPVEPSMGQQIGIGYVNVPGQGNIRVFEVNGEDGQAYKFAPDNGMMYDDMGRPVRQATDREIAAFMPGGRVARTVRTVR